MVVAAHLGVVWLLMSTVESFKTKSDSLTLLWLTRPKAPETAAEQRTSSQRAPTRKSRRRADRAPASSAITTLRADKDHASAAVPDWAEELQLAAKDALAKDLVEKRHNHDFAHTFPVQPKSPPQIAWDHAATHRVEAIPGGGIAINLNDNCVLVLIPLPLVGCGIGKHPANGDLFKHSDK
jgi:hypothetical protein